MLMGGGTRENALTTSNQQTTESESGAPPIATATAATTWPRQKLTANSLGGVQRHERRPKAGREVGRRLRYATLRAGDLGRVAAQEVVHRLRGGGKTRQNRDRMCARGRLAPSLPFISSLI